MMFIVICREDRNPDDTPGRYVLATRRLFRSRSEASRYAETISLSREPIIVEGNFHALRLGERE